MKTSIRTGLLLFNLCLMIASTYGAPEFVVPSLNENNGRFTSAPCDGRLHGPLSLKLHRTETPQQVILEVFLKQIAVDGLMPATGQQASNENRGS